MEPVRLGVIGCGVIGKKHMDSAAGADHIDLVAAADLVEANRVEAAEKFRPRRVYASAEELLADGEVEAVVLALPTMVRTKLALAALSKGKHVLLEKPAAMNAADLRRIMAARGKLTVGCCSSRPQFKAHVPIVKELIASGRLGQIRELHVRCLGGCGAKPAKPGPAWRLRRDLNGGGILVNWGCYDLDYLMGLTGWTLRPRVVLAQAWAAPPAFARHIDPTSDAETHFTALVRCEGGEAISIERGEFTATGKQNGWQIVGDAGSLDLTMVSDDPIRITHYAADAEKGATERVIYDATEGWGEMHAGPVRDFAAAIRQGREPLTGLERSLTLQRLTDAIYESARSGSAVTIG
ncbi:MAG: Inositol 2-dehydrogenase/D-chiro-inositol 3-dehydrogenase [Phycisphaerae bacterium]|nr:Inositol 2-dehydrogenase/D-chiro-inositol 3-dehydrogenase [Phycisphaerae bacterium]